MMTNGTGQAEDALTTACAIADRIRRSLAGVVFGQAQAVDGVVVALLAGGHVLLEGAPGLGKTQIVRTLSELVGGAFARIQCTPDLMPSDIVGTSLVVSTAEGGKDIVFRPGPIFANLVLADEINRATPKTQSAMLEAMAERTVTVDGRARALPAPFFVLATQNPIEMEGVFTLPEAQLDRFLMKIVVRMPDLETLVGIGARAGEAARVEQTTSPAQLAWTQAVARSIACPAHVLRYSARLVLATHAHAAVRHGAGPRAVQALVACAKARALLAGRAAATVDDVRAVAPDVLRHRVIVRFEAEAHGVRAEQIVHQTLEATERGECI